MSSTFPDLVRDTPLGPEWHDLFRDLRAGRTEGDLWITMMGVPVRVISRYADIKAFFGDHVTHPGGATYEFSLTPALGPTFMSMDGADHALYRKLATPAFRSRPAERFIDEQMAPLAHEIVDRFADRGEADLVAEFTDVLPFWSISRKVGFPDGSEEQQRTVARALLTYPLDRTGALAAAAEVTALVEPLLDDRRACPRDDVLSHLVTSTADGVCLSDAQVLSHLRLLYAVGATTTADEMSNLLHLLLSRPELVERVRRDPALRPRIVHEALRYEPPVAALPRVDGDGNVVLLVLAAGNRDPEVFADPDTFDPDREDAMLLSFGFGSKFCPGSHFGRRQLTVALDVLLDRLPNLRLVSSDGPTGNTLRSTKRLVAAWDPA